MLLLLAGLGAVLAVQVMSKIGPSFVLQLQRLRDQLLAAGEVLAGGDDRERLLAGEQGVVGMDELRSGELHSIWRANEHRVVEVEHDGGSLARAREPRELRQGEILDADQAQPQAPRSRRPGIARGRPLR